jgi:hypothetical protein
MGKIVMSEGVSLDGVIEDPDGCEGVRVGGWVGQIKDRDEVNKVKLDEALGTEALLLVGGAVSFNPRVPATPQRLDVELLEAGQSTAHRPRRERERDPLRQQAASHERERAGRSAVEPLRIVDHAQQRLPLSSFGEQAQNREPDKERARRLSGTEPEGDTERVTLKIRETLDELEDRCTTVGR